MSKRLLGIATVFIALLLIFWTVSSRGRTPEVVTAAAARENLSATIISNGKVEPLEPYVLRAQFDTFVQDVQAREGQEVRRGALLLTLAADDVRAALDREREAWLAAQEQLSAARAGGTVTEVVTLDADLKKADAEVARLRAERDALNRLLARQAATRLELEQNQTALANAETLARALRQRREDLDRRSRNDVERMRLQVESLRTSIRALEDKLASARVAAPVNGTVYSLRPRKGDLVRLGDVLAEVADLSRIRVRAFVDEPELGNLAAGQDVEITWDATPGRIWHARTEGVPRAVVQRGSRSVGEVLCSVADARSDLLPNTTVNLRIKTSERRGVVTVPRAAVRQDGEARYVFVVEAGKLRRRTIKLGMGNFGKFEVLEGLKDGERVVLPGEFELRDGMDVRVAAP